MKRKTSSFIFFFFLKKDYNSLHVTDTPHSSPAQTEIFILIEKQYNNNLAIISFTINIHYNVCNLIDLFNFLIFIQSIGLVQWLSASNTIINNNCVLSKIKGIAWCCEFKFVHKVKWNFTSKVPLNLNVTWLDLFL